MRLRLVGGIRALGMLLLSVAAVAQVAGRTAGAEPGRDPHILTAVAETPPLLRDAARVPPGSEGPGESLDDESLDSDPWAPFNTRTFEFNRQLDRLVVKPVATGWDRAVPADFRQGIKNAFQNLGMPRRLVNSLLQLKFEGALREVARFVLNSTVGVGGLFDVAREERVEPSDEDLGQTFGVYGVGTGPYLVLPFLPPSTVRDTIGSVGDAFLDPLGVTLSLVERIGTRAVTTVNDRSLNLELFEEIEESVLDLYTAVRHGYIQRRSRAVQE